MATPTTLFDYYTQLKQPLPSLSQRAPIFQQFGLGPASSYIGSADQNTKLLQALMTKGTQETSAPNFSSVTKGQIYVPPPTFTQPTSPTSAPQQPQQPQQPQVAAGNFISPSTPPAATGDVTKDINQRYINDPLLRINLELNDKEAQAVADYLKQNPGAPLPTGGVLTQLREAANKTDTGAAAPSTDLTSPGGLQSLFSSLGLLMPQANQSPTSSAADVYKQFAEQYGLFESKKQIAAIIDKETSEIASVNENPWISEALRSKKVSQIQDKYDLKLKLMQSQFDRADEDARFITGKYLEQVHQTKEDTQHLLFKAIDIAEKEIAGRRTDIREREREREFDLREERIGRQADIREKQFEEREARQQRQFEARESRQERQQREREREFKARQEQQFKEFQEREERIGGKKKIKPTDGGSIWGHIKGFFGGLHY